MSWSERLTFLKQLVTEGRHTGAVQPSSRHLARAMTRPLRRELSSGPPPVRVLEIGPGTGAVTRVIVEALRPGDRLDCYEINPEFAEFLRRRIAEDPAFAEVRDGIRVVCAPAQSVAAGNRGGAAYGFAVCSAPFNNFEPEIAEELFGAGLEVLREPGTFSWFEYLALPTLVRLLAPPRERRRLASVQRLERRLCRRFPTRVERVWLNLPPARVRHLRKEDRSGDRHAEGSTLGTSENDRADQSPGSEPASSSRSS